MPSIRDVLTQTRVIDISLAGPKVEEYPAPPKPPERIHGGII